MKLLIIDDEPLIHISIEKLIHNYDKEIEVFHAYNGQEMQTMLQNHDFLLAYVDIKLPGISGLEAIRMAKETAPHTIYYIMTGFDSFEYAKEAIKLKVEDYLMKPLDYETIKNTIISAGQIRASHTKERKTMFRHWLESVLNHQYFPLERYTGYYRLSLLITGDQEEFPSKQLLDKLMPYNDNFVSVISGKHILLLCFSENADMLRTISRELSSETYSRGMTLFLSSIVKSSSEMKTSIEHLMEYSCLRVILGTETFYSIKPLLNYDPELVKFCKICETWQASYEQKNYNDFITLSETVGSRLNSDPSLKKFRTRILDFIRLVLGESFPVSVTADELGKVFQKHAAHILHSSGSERLIDSIIQYIQEHYCDNLSTTMLSEQFGLSSNYITNLLKQELGIRYNDYITQLRMEHAKELLLTTSLSVKSITTECGYYSQSHFTKLFVEKEGCTPVEYRKRSIMPS